MYLPNVRRSGSAPSSAARPERPWREVITSSAMQTAPASRAAAKRPRRNVRLGGDAAAGAEHRLDEDGGDSSCSSISAIAAVEIVVRRDHERIRRVPGRHAVREVEDAAVVAAVEDEHLLAAGEHPRRGDREQVRLGAGVREAHAVEPEALAHEPRRARPRAGGRRPTLASSRIARSTASSTRRSPCPKRPAV